MGQAKLGPGALMVYARRKMRKPQNEEVAGNSEMLVTGRIFGGDPKDKGQRAAGHEDSHDRQLAT